MKQLISWKKKSLLILITISSLSSMAYLYGQSGLDTNSDQNFDETLETMSSEEELFENVAELISSFVKTQRNIREKLYNLKQNRFRWALSPNKEKYNHILEDLPNKGRYASRDVHRKTHGCYQAQFNISDSLYENINQQISETQEQRSQETIQGTNLIPELLQTQQDLGIFQPGEKYKAIVRLSNGNPDNNPDKAPDARGFAVKFLPPQLDLNVTNSEEINSNTLLDILTINYPTFFVNSASKYFIINKWFLKSTEDNRSYISSKLYETFSVFGPSFLNGAGLTELEKKLALKVNGSIINHPLYENYFSMVPSRLGSAGQARAVKYVWIPVSCNGGELKDKEKYKPQWSIKHNYSYPTAQLTRSAQRQPPYKEKWDHYYLRNRVKKTLSEDNFCYDLSIQLYRDQISTNIEDSMDIWLSSEEERKTWIEDVVNEMGNSLEAKTYRQKIKQKKIAPRITVGRLEFNKLAKNQKVGNSKFCEDLSFNPWHGNIDFHKPLGQVSRMKQKVYNAVRRHRHKLNGIDSRRMEREQ